MGARERAREGEGEGESNRSGLAHVGGDPTLLNPSEARLLTIELMAGLSQALTRRFGSVPAPASLTYGRLDEPAASTPKMSDLPAADRCGLPAWGPCPLSPCRRHGGVARHSTRLALGFLLWGWGFFSCAICSWARPLPPVACLLRVMAARPGLCGIRRRCVPHALRLGSPVVAARLWPRPIHCPGFLSGRGAGPPASSRGWGRTRCVPLPPSPADAATCEKTGSVRPRSRPLALDSLAVSGFRVQGQRGWGSPEPVFSRSRRAPRFGAGIGEFWQAPLDRATIAAQPPKSVLLASSGSEISGCLLPPSKS